MRKRTLHERGLARAAGTEAIAFRMSTQREACRHICAYNRCMYTCMRTCNSCVGFTCSTGHEYVGVQSTPPFLSPFSSGWQTYSIIVHRHLCFARAAKEPRWSCRSSMLIIARCSHARHTKTTQKRRRCGGVPFLVGRRPQACMRFSQLDTEGRNLKFRRRRGEIAGHCCLCAESKRFSCPPGATPPRRFLGARMRRPLFRHSPPRLAPAPLLLCYSCLLSPFLSPSLPARLRLRLRPVAATEHVLQGLRKVLLRTRK